MARSFRASGIQKHMLELDDMIDITQVDYCQIVIREDGKVVWINIDGKCRLRACAIKNVFVDDQREEESDG